MRQQYLRRYVDGKSKALHTIIAERALGRPLPTGVQVHHVNEDKFDNRPENLVICRAAYHMLLHVRTRALEDCGHADWRKCWICKDYSDPATMFRRANNKSSEYFIHLECRRSYWNEQRKNRSG